MQQMFSIFSSNLVNQIMLDIHVKCLQADDSHEILSLIMSLDSLLLKRKGTYYFRCIPEWCWCWPEFTRYYKNQSMDLKQRVMDLTLRHDNLVTFTNFQGHYWT